MGRPRDLPQAQTHTFEGAGHIPHISHPEAYMERLIGFVDGSRNPSP
ncbi:alpha/beta fold hydrolase [Streptomyces sp. NPDC002073]